MHSDIDHVICAGGVLMAAIMFAAVYYVVRAPAEAGSMSTNETSDLIRDLVRQAAANQSVCTYVLAMILVLKGTGRVAFITGTLTLAVAIVNAMCPAFLQLVVDVLAAVFFQPVPSGP